MSRNTWARPSSPPQIQPPRRACRADSWSEPHRVLPRSTAVASYLYRCLAPSFPGLFSTQHVKFPADRAKPRTFLPPADPGLPSPDLGLHRPVLSPLRPPGTRGTHSSTPCLQPSFPPGPSD